MASAFAHALIPSVICFAFRSKSLNWRVFLLAVICSILPDADVLAFKFGIPYESQWGHRGFTHSISFSAVISIFAACFYRQLRSRPLIIFAVCLISGISHALLDAMTNGGLGVALYWPINSERIFFSFRPIQVSPIGVGAFFTSKGLKVISSELIWIAAPCIFLSLLGAYVRRQCDK